MYIEQNNIFMQIYYFKYSIFMQSHFQANTLFLVQLYFHAKNIVSNVVVFMQLHFHADILFFILQFLCDFHANI